jgi:hypothetical protein
MSIAVLEASTGPIAVLSGHVRMPLRGLWLAFLELDVDAGEHVTIGPIELVIAGDDGQSVTRLRGTVLEDDVVADEGRARCIVRGGAGLLHAARLSQRDYLKSPFDVSVGLIVRDAVEDASELLADDAVELLSTIRVPRWHRAGGCSAVEVLDRLAELFAFTWRLDDDGAVRVRLLEEYPELDASVAEQVVRTGLDDAYSKTIEVAPPAAVIRPGQTVLGRRIDEVVYRIDSSSLRAELYYGIGGGTASDVAATVRAAIPSLVYREIHDATVRRQNLDGSLDIEADDPRVGALSSVPYCPGIVGCRLVFAEGDRVRLAWQNGDETRPFAFAPEMLQKPTLPPEFAPWGVGVARVGDRVTGGAMQFVATPDANGGIGAIVITYQSPLGTTTMGTLLPGGVPLVFDISGKIQTGSSEVFIRGTSG